MAQARVLMSMPLAGSKRASRISPPEKEFAQATGRTDTLGKTDQQTFHAVLSKRENRYLVRQLCWVLTIQGLETYLLAPRDPADIDLLVEAIRPVPSQNDIDINDIDIDQIYSFDRDALIKAIPKPAKTTAAQFGPAAEELFNRIMQMTDNAGATDEHRALNYLAMRYPAIYARAAEEFAQAFSLTGVEVRPSPLSSTRMSSLLSSPIPTGTRISPKSFPCGWM
jgi:hypothetical protein